MKTIAILKPNNFTFPLSKDVFEGNNIAYHGTSSVFTEVLEREGWILTKQPYLLEDIKFLIKCFDDINYSTVGSEICRPRALDSEKSAPSFTQDYWVARNYARNSLGETFHYFLDAIDNYTNLIRDNNKILNHKQKLEVDINKNKKYLENLSLNERLKKNSDRLQKIKNKYIDQKKLHFPVVYILKINPDNFPKWSDPRFIHDDHTINSRVYTLETRPKTSIHPESIIVRIIFPNGAQRWRQSMNKPLPLPWAMERFINWYNDKMREKYCIFYHRYEDPIDLEELNFSYKEIGEKLIENQVIPNVVNIEPTHFDMKIRGVISKTRKDCIYQYDLRLFNTERNACISSKINQQLNTISYITRDKYGRFEHIVLSINRQYPLNI